MGLHFADAAVLLLYLGVITVVGVRAGRLVTNLGDFFMPRRFGKVMLSFFAFGTGTHSDQAVSVASKTYTNGLSGIWYQWLWLFCTPFYWLIAPMMRRFRAITMADVLSLRYNRSIAFLFALVGMLQLMVNIGVMLKGSGAVVASCFGGALSADAVILAMTVIFVVYGIAGGLSAAVITDFIQGILTVLFSFLLLPFVMEAVGGLPGLHRSIGDRSMFSLVAPAEIGFFYIVVIAFNALVGIVTQPHTMGNCAAGRTEMDGRVGFTAGNFIKRICTMAWCLTGLAGVTYFAGRSIHPDQVFGLIAADFLPRIMPGLLGLFLASLLASVMSSCDAFMVASSALFTENIYKQALPERSDRHYVTVARIASLVIVAGGVLFAFRLPGVVKGLEIFWKVSPMIGMAFWLGFFWRRATAAGAWAATLTGFGVWWLTSLGFVVRFLGALPGADALRLTIDKGAGAEIYLPWQMILYLSAGSLLGIVVSLLTRPESPEKLDRFFELARTPVRTGEPPPEAACRLPEGVRPASPDNLIRAGGLEIQKPGPVSIAGFVVCWAVVGALIGFFYLITQ